ncbi:MAG: DNA methyltransferase [Spirochaetia bacterium]|jgi:DNA modification methylase
MPRGPGEAIIYLADSRRMPEIAAESIELVVTSPPYWQIKDYDSAGQIGHGQSLHAYLGDLARVWAECFRVTREAGRLCVNIGDQFARANLFGRYSVIPLHAEIISQCVASGFDYLGSIIWRKKTTMNTSGGAVVMGSYPYPPNGIVEIDFEYILLFKKPGKPRKVPPEVKQAAALSRDEWKSWFSGHWDVGGARKKGHEAPFPIEIPRRLIRMFTFPGDTVLDPFLGTGTTAAAALELGRNALGYEINKSFVSLARERLEKMEGAPHISVAERKPDQPAALPAPAALPVPVAWRPSVPDMIPQTPATGGAPAPELHTVASVGEDCTLTLDTGARVLFLGVQINDMAAARDYLRRRVLKKKIFLRDPRPGVNSVTHARVILKNRISINAQLVKSGAATKIPEPEG